jgi:hypothetical protein
MVVDRALVTVSQAAVQSETSRYKPMEHYERSVLAI